MFQNIKVDIIYFKTYTDFELEFNLCGCCRMRLLTDKAPDKKTLVHSLARAVSRSRVIIIAGKLLGDEGTIGLISHSIGKETAVIDKAQYGISARCLTAFFSRLLCREARFLCFRVGKEEGCTFAAC